jgi:regulator of sirC expression with transglutaminase-like and TPR domain
VKTPKPILTPEILSETRRAALLDLLTDEDPSVYQAIREKIISFGPSVLQWLRPLRLSNEPLLRRRVEEIVLFLSRQESDNAFLAFCLSKGEDFDIEEGAWLLARSEYPDINAEAYGAILDDFSLALQERIQGLKSPRAVLGKVNEFLFEERGFAGNRENYYDPENSFLNRVIDRRTGNPINLCLLYIVVARRLKLPVTGIGLPGHFICRHQSSAEEVFIDVFNQGRFLSKAECVRYLVQASLGFKDDYLVPVTPRRMLLRICANLHQIYTQSHQESRVTRFQRYIVALAR